MAANGRHLLDDPGLYASLDPSGLRERIRDLPNHYLAAWKKACACSFPPEWSFCDKVVIGGMGGSAIAGDLTADLAAAQKTVPILVVRDVRLPFAIDERTLFIACSYSGNTEETLSLFDQAMDARARVIAISSGGRLTQRADARGVPLLKFDMITEPRSAVGYNLMVLLGVLRRARLLQIEEEEVSVAIEALFPKIAALREDVPLANNLAKQLATDLVDRLIVVYGSGLFSGMARRWKSQFNENAKVWAFSELVPEILHNSVEAYGAPPPVTGWVSALLLQPAANEPVYARHNRVVFELLRRNNISHMVLAAENAPPLAQLLHMLLLGDYVSYYLAMLHGVDPSPNPSIDAAKGLLANPP